MTPDEPFTLDWNERDVVRHILAEVERRGYDDTNLDPVVRNLNERLRDRWRVDREGYDGRDPHEPVSHHERRPEP